MKEIKELAKDIAIVAHPDTRDLVEHRALIVLNAYHDEIVEQIERGEFELTPLDDSLKAGMSLDEANATWNYARGYNEALSDLKSSLTPQAVGLPENIMVMCECGKIFKTAKGNKEEDGFKCECGRPIVSPL